MNEPLLFDSTTSSPSISTTMLFSHPQTPALVLSTTNLLPRQNLSESCPPSLLCNQICCLPPSTCNSNSFLAPFCQPPSPETQEERTCEEGRKLCPDGVSCCFIGFQCDSTARMCWAPSPAPLFDTRISESGVLTSLPLQSQERLSFSTNPFTTGSVTIGFNSMSFLPPSNLSIEASTSDVSTSTAIRKSDITSTTYPSPPFTSFQSTNLPTTSATTSEPPTTGGSQPNGNNRIRWKVLGMCFWLMLLVAG